MVNNTTQNAQKPTILISKIQKKNLGGAQLLPQIPSQWGGGHPLPTPYLPWFIVLYALCVIGPHKIYCA